MPNRIATEGVPYSPSEGKGGEAGTFGDERIDVGGVERAYRLVVPKSIDPEKPAPLVFAFHGLFDNKDFMPFYSRLNLLAAEHGCIVIYPNSRGAYWPLVPKWAEPDLAFFDALYDLVTTRYNVDLNRVFLAGMSNGAYFTHVIASQRSDKIAAIAAHSGGMGLLGRREIDVEHKYAVFIVHGDRDSIVSVTEGRKTRDLYEQLEHPVEYVEVPGLNHFWAHQVGINDKIWKFFESHPRTEVEKHDVKRM